MAAVLVASLGIAMPHAKAATNPATGVTAFTVDAVKTTTSAASALVGAAGAISGFWQDGRVIIQTTSPTTAHVSLAAPTGAALAAGTTYPTASAADATHALLSLSVPGLACAAPTGTVRVDDVTSDDTGAVTGIGASYAVSCDGGRQVVGEARWNSTTEVVRAVASAGSTAPTQTVTMHVAAGDSFGQADLAAPAGAFRIVGDTCSNQTFAVEGSCTVSVSSVALRLGGVQGLLTLPATTGTAHAQPLTVVGTETPRGGFAAVNPYRVLDTRAATGVSTRTKMGPRSTISFQVTGRGGVPTGGAAAVVLNLTVTGPTSSSYLTAYPYGGARPVVSSLNFPPGWTGANLVTVPVSSNGRVAIYNNAGSVHVIADVVGYYRTSAATAMKYGSYVDANPFQVFNTASGGSALPAGYYTTGWVSFGANIDPHVRSVALAITVSQPKGTGYVTAFDGNAAATPTPRR